MNRENTNKTQNEGVKKLISVIPFPVGKHENEQSEDPIGRKHSNPRHNTNKRTKDIGNLNSTNGGKLQRIFHFFFF